MYKRKECLTVAQVDVAMLIGIPGSGKSTWGLDAIKNTEGPVRYISSDEIRERQFGDVADMDHNNKVFSIMLYELADALSRKEAVVLDATFVKRSERAPYLKLAKKHGANVTAYFVKTELDEALKRNAQRKRKVPPEAIRQRHAELEEPTEAEGFNRIIFIDG
ncbi:MAG: ATP-binding protein [Bacillota bacterium]|nr:ATP-binding protein [Bacillota bacterium]